MNRKTGLLVFLICAVCANAFVYYFVAQEKFVYSWDWANYWLKYQHLSDMLKHAPLKALKSVAHSVRHDDYNLLAVLFLTPWNLVFGDSRVAFILSVTNILAVPSAAVLALSVTKASSERPGFDATVAFSLSLFAILLLPQFWMPVLYGEIGVAGILVIGLIFLVYFARHLHEHTFPELLAMGGLLACLVLVRRWYAYWVVAFFVAVAIETMTALIARHVRMPGFLISLRNLIVVGASSVAFLFVFATPIAKRMFVTDYASLYSAWQYGKSFADITLTVVARYGASLLVLFLVGAFFTIMSKSTRRISLFVFVQGCVAFLLFSRTQLMGPQHNYILLPAASIVISLSWVNALQLRKGYVSRALCSCMFAGLLVLNCLVVFIPGVSDSMKGASVLLPSDRHYPMVRNDLIEMRRLLDVMEHDLLHKRDGPVYVLASSTTILNDEILRHACTEFAEQKSICSRILIVHHVDKRDGFPHQFLDARYVITTTPLLHHLRLEDQRVIGMPAEAVGSGRGIGSSYRRLPYEFILDGNVKVHIYERVSPLRRGDIEALFKEFALHYPEWGVNFSISPLCGLISAREAGDRVGQISCHGRTLFIRPGAHTPSRVVLALAKEFTVMRTTLAFRDSEKVPVACRDTDGEVALSITADGIRLYQDNVSYRNPVPLDLNLQGIDTLEILVDKGRNGPDCDWFFLKDVVIE